MGKEYVRSLLVTSKREGAGIVTETDIISMVIFTLLTKYILALKAIRSIL